MKDYKKILEGVVNIINTTEKSDIGFANICTYIGENCPELAESKDERIRKELIDFLEYYRLNNVLDSKTISLLTDSVAWLEKQGDKDKLIKELGEYKVKYTQEVLSQQLEKKAEPTDILANAVLDSNKDGLIADTIQSKPKFKVGDKIYLKPEYRMPDDDTPIANTVKEIRRIDDKYYRFDRSYIFIEDQDKYELVEQKSAEWSDTDKSNLSELCGFVVESYRPEDASRLITWLNDIKDRVQLQPKQEWSEEDEDNLNSAIYYIRREPYRECDVEPIVDWLRNKLKSLRPHSSYHEGFKKGFAKAKEMHYDHWKPSERQLDVLKSAINELDAYDDSLTELYNDLKKLKD